MKRPTSKSRKGAEKLLPRILFTLGDPSGIGPEVVLKSLLPLRLGGVDSLGLVGPRLLWEIAAKQTGVLSPEAQEIPVIEPPGHEKLTESTIRSLLFSARVHRDAAKLGIESLQTAVDLAADHPDSVAVVTSPINKRAFREAGETDRGHTEWLARRFGVETPVMLMVAGELRVAVSTTHLPIRDVASSLRTETLLRQFEVIASALHTRFGISEPRIALLALNPHGGEGGEPDREEEAVLRPALEQARSSGIDAAGLFSADAFFGRARWRSFDAVLVPYHDQGLIPVKVEAAGAGVNVTLGLPIVRVAPDHGTAFDIAGRGVASSDAVLAAARLADRMLKGRPGN